MKAIQTSGEKQALERTAAKEVQLELAQPLKVDLSNDDLGRVAGGPTVMNF